ncbi:MAG: hypothetical protein SGI86_01160 [Deltaproteobacteria bacterium]|nr:hypothetical protein [Deltaproteobacteria bacterium]
MRIGAGTGSGFVATVGSGFVATGGSGAGGGAGMATGGGVEGPKLRAGRTTEFAAEGARAGNGAPLTKGLDGRAIGAGAAFWA